MRWNGGAVRWGSGSKGAGIRLPAGGGNAATG